MYLDPWTLNNHQAKTHLKVDNKVEEYVIENFKVNVNAELKYNFYYLGLFVAGFAELVSNVMNYIKI